MLVYIRESERDEIMRDIMMKDIPLHLKERFDEENDTNRRLEKEEARNNECSSIYIVTQETILGWDEAGIC
jgi:hypothetical protein